MSSSACERTARNPRGGFTKQFGYVLRRSRLLAGVLTAILSSHSVPARSENYAVLVGVSGYAETSGLRSLPGARNDILRMHEILLGRGFSGNRIRMLADGVPGAEVPTRKNILAGLSQTALQVKPGDFVYIHFSGHGAQQPAIRLPQGADPEPDGKTELFLPLDVGRWDEREAAVRNAIPDHELIPLLTQILNKGAFVWSVFDACHSASLMKGSDNQAVARSVTARELGIPDSAWQRAAPAASQSGSSSRGAQGSEEDPLWSGRAGSANKGNYVSFYAAQPSEEAPEMPMPMEYPAGDSRKKPHGVLTFTLAEGLEASSALTYRQLTDFILQRYSTRSFARKPTPAFSGTGLDADVFGLKSETGSGRQWAVREQDGSILVPAGVLNELSRGAILGIYPGPRSSNDEIYARAEVVSGGLFESRARVMHAVDGRPVAIRAGSYARLMEPKLSFALRVALPSQPDSTDRAMQSAFAGISKVRSDAGSDSRLQWVEQGEPADIALALNGGQLRIAPSDRPFTKLENAQERTFQAVTVDVSDRNFEANLRSALDRVARGVRLIRAVNAMGGEEGHSRIHVTLERRAKATASRTNDQIRSGTLARLRAGDVVRFAVANKGDRPADVTLLYLDAEYGIKVLYPAQGQLNRLEPGDVLRSEDLAPTNGGILLDANTVGVERLIVLAVSARPHGSQVDFAFLAQTGTQSRSGADSVLEDWLSQVVTSGQYRSVTRGSADGTKAGESLARMYSWEIAR